MWLIILHVLINVLGLIFLLAGSFQILISAKAVEQKNRLIEWGWYLYTVGVILGAFQAKEMLGYYWSWDLKETLSLFTVIGYLLYIILEMKWKTRSKRFLIGICLILAVFTLIGPTFINSYHDPLNI
ncbi:MAG: cytochrome c biogenesis protein CcsA [Promethearchaeota archaeon]